jgi:hypothetical protein
MPYVPFEEVEALASIEQLAEMLRLETHRYGNAGQLRASCPLCGGDNTTLAISPGVRSKRGSLGVFFCQRAKKGGDRIGLVAHCMGFETNQNPQQDAAHFIQEQFGTSAVTSTENNKKRTTVPTSPEGRSQPAPNQFDPDKFAARLHYSDEVAALGISEEDAERLGIGWHPQRKAVYFPIRNPDGSKSGFIGHKDGKLVLPPQWLAGSPKVVSFKRPA